MPGTWLRPSSAISRNSHPSICPSIDPQSMLSFTSSRPLPPTRSTRSSPSSTFNPDIVSKPQPEKPLIRVIYTCPMHPEIRQEGPGNCPICGMALEPITAGIESGPNPELVDMTRRFWIGTALTAPLVLLELGAHIPGLGLHTLISPQASVWLQFLLATPVVLWAGW